MMNNEIKEILDKLKNHIEGIRYANLTNYELRLLLDYITNLQEENNVLKDTMAKIKDLNTMKYLRDDIFKYYLSEILKGEDNGKNNNRM